MKKMRNSVKLLLAMLVMVMAFAVTGTTAQAAGNTKKITLYIGEKLESQPLLGSITKVKSSNKKVATVKKKAGKALITPKKAGKTTITIGSTYGSYSYKVTVKKAKFAISTSVFDDEYLWVTVKNKNKDYFDSVYLTCTIRNSSGTVLGTEKIYIYYMNPKTTAYGKKWIYPSDYPGADISKTTYKVTWSRSLSKTYKDYTKNVNYSVSESNGKVVMKTNVKKKLSSGQYVYAAWDMIWYDASGKVVYVNDYYNYMSSSKKSDTYSITKPYGAVTYKIVNKRAMFYTYN